MSEKISVGVLGGSGRLGSYILKAIEGDLGFDKPVLYKRGDSLDILLKTDVIIDATHIDFSKKAVDFAIKNKKNIIIGTSGWKSEEINAFCDIDSHSIVFIPNFSIGSTLATSLAAVSCKFFNTAEIIEAHPERKKDSPSGTARLTAEIISNKQKFNPPNADQKARGELIGSVPVHSLRISGVDAYQEVVFGGGDERLVIRHETLSPDAYILGIQASLKYALNNKGLTVGLNNVLGLKI